MRHRDAAQSQAFVRRCCTEMAAPEPAHTIALLALLALPARYTNFAVGCGCGNEAHCHRSVRRELLAERGAALVQPAAAPPSPACGAAPGRAGASATGRFLQCRDERRARARAAPRHPRIAGRAGQPDRGR